MTSFVHLFAFILCSVVEAVSHPFIVILFEAVDLFALLKPPFGRAVVSALEQSSFFRGC